MSVKLTCIGLYGYFLAFSLAAAGDPKPVYTVLKDTAQDATASVLCDALGVVPYGKIAVFAYKFQDAVRLMGEAANDYEDERVRTFVILSNRDRDILESLKSQGRDLATDPDSVAARAQLTLLVQKLYEGSDSNIVHAGKITLKHLGYATFMVGKDKAFSTGVGWILPGGETEELLKSKGSLRKYIRMGTGWENLKARDAIGQAFARDWQKENAHGLVDLLIKASMEKGGDLPEKEALQEIANANPSQARLVLDRLPDIRALAAAAATLPFPAAAAAAAPEPEAPAVPDADVDISDAVTHGIVADQVVTRNRSRSTPQPASTITHGYDQGAPTPAWVIRMHESYQNFHGGSKHTWDGRDAVGD